MAQKRRDIIRKRRKKLDVNIDEGREAKLGIIVGRKGVGKTFTTLKELEKYVRGNIKKGIMPRRVLIFDVNNEFSQFKTIALSNIKRWCDYGKIEIRRVSVFKAMSDVELNINDRPVYNHPSGKMSINDMANALEYILENIYNAAFLVEDISKYISDSLPNSLIGSLCTMRHRGVDVILHYQTIGKFAHPKILGNANYLRMHRTSDRVKRHESKFGDYTEPLYICEKLVEFRYRMARNRAEKSYYAYLDTDDMRIKGNFSKQEYALAVIQYLRANYNTIVKPKVNEVDLISGKKRYPNQQAVIKALILEKIEEYYGN